MRTIIKRGSHKGKGLGLAWIAIAIWVLMIAGTWFAYRDSSGSEGGLINFIGRFHPLFVHMPIGFIFLALIIEIASFLKKFAHLQTFQTFVLWLCLLSGIVATLFGYFLMAAEDFAGHAMDMHLYFGLSVVVCSLFALISSHRRNLLFQRIWVGASMFTCSAAGHFGGAMVHTPEYLTEHAPSALVPFLEIGLNSETSEETGPSAEVPVGEQLVYQNFIAPMMAGKCNECHNANKTKGKLRTDTHEFLLAGATGSDFTTVDPSNSDESELVFRSELPRDDDEAMPPDDDPLTAEELQILRAWIDAGATQELTVAELGEAPSIEKSAYTLVSLYTHSDLEATDGTDTVVSLSVWDTLEPEEQTRRLNDVKAAAAAHHFSVMPVSAEDDRLRINVINASKEFGDEQLSILEPVAERIVWLDLGRSQISDIGMEAIGGMINLERLHLENTAVTDDGVASLTGLPKLEYLNLYSTKVGNGVFDTFATLPSLRKVYVWQTEVEASVARSFERSVNLEVNTGIELAAETPAETPKSAAATTAKPKGETTPKVAPKVAPKAKPKTAETAPSEKNGQPRVRKTPSQVVAFGAQPAYRKKTREPESAYIS